MTIKTTGRKVGAMKRLDSRILEDQYDYIAKEMKRTGDGQGEVLRTLLAEAISNRKRK